MHHLFQNIGIRCIDIVINSFLHWFWNQHYYRFRNKLCKEGAIKSACREPATRE